MRMNWRALLYLSLSCVASPMANDRSRADEAQTIQALKDQGATITATKGTPTGLNIADCSKLTEADYKAIGSLTSLKNLGLGLGLTDQALPSLAGLSQLQVFSTNGLKFNDPSVKAFTPFKNLRSLAFFHPGAQFTGSGLSQLGELSHLERLTVAGSFAFGDEGMAAVGGLKTLKEFRVWHAGNTNQGVRKLRALPALESLNLGQRLTHKGDACPNDETVVLLVEMKSLKSLELQEARLSYDSLARLKQLAGLKKLTLNGIDIADSDVERLKADMPDVRITFTRPNDVFQRRIDALFGKK